MATENQVSSWDSWSDASFFPQIAVTRDGDYEGSGHSNQLFFAVRWQKQCGAVTRARRPQIVFQLSLAAPGGVQVGEPFRPHAHKIESRAFRTCNTPQSRKTFLQLPAWPAFDCETLPTGLMVLHQTVASQRNVEMHERVGPKRVKDPIFKRNLAIQFSGGNDDIHRASLRGGPLLRAHIDSADYKTGCAEVRSPHRKRSGFVELQSKVYEYKFLTRQLLAQQFNVFLARQHIGEDRTEKKNRRDRHGNGGSGISQHQRDQRDCNADGHSQKMAFAR